MLCEFFKENNDKSKEKTTLTAGYVRVELDKHILETIESYVYPFNLSSLLIHLLVEEPSLRRQHSVPAAWAYVGDDPVGMKCDPEVIPVKSRVKVAEKAVRGNAGVSELLRNLVHPLPCIIGSVWFPA